MQVLVVEDECLIRMLVCNLLEEAGYVCIEAANAIEALALLVTVYLLIFARIYVANSQNDPAGFSSPLGHVNALYFTVTVFATVGFGDIVALTESMKLLVTAQMLLNLVVLGLGIRLLTSAARRGIARRGGQTDVGEPDRPGF